MGLKRSSSKADTRANSLRLSFKESGSNDPMQPRNLFSLPMSHVTKSGHEILPADYFSLTPFSLRKSDVESLTFEFPPFYESPLLLSG